MAAGTLNLGLNVTITSILLTELSPYPWKGSLLSCVMSVLDALLECSLCFYVFQAIERLCNIHNGHLVYEIYPPFYRGVFSGY